MDEQRKRWRIVKAYDPFECEAEVGTLKPTETSNIHHPFRHGDFETLSEGLDYAAKGRTGFNFFSSRGDLAVAMTYQETRDRAIDLAARLTATGMKRGSRLALIAESTPDVLVFFFACQYAGLIPVPLPISIHLGGHDSYVERLRGMLASSRPSAAMASEELIETLREATDGLGVSLVGTPRDFHGLSSKRGELAPFQRGEPCYIQYSSGSTTQPRGVLVSQRAITSNARAISQFGLELRPGDRGMSWLPLYHDMGLVGFCLTPMMSQVSVDYLATTTFALRPLTWFKVISEHGGTVSFSPTFGYELCLRRAAKGVSADLDLSRWRIAGIGGEMVRADILDQFATMFGSVGFDRTAFVPSYGLAEATLAVSFTQIGTGIKVDKVDRDRYERTGLAVPAQWNVRSSPHKTRSFVSCGKILPGYSIEIRDDDDEVLPNRTIGRVCIQGPSLMKGYFRNPEATHQALMADGWLDTGDMGYMIDDELVVTGRRKDMIICNGRNIWPQDLEWCVENVPGVRSGCVAAFSVAEGDEEERVVIVVECYSADSDKRAALVREISRNVHKTAGVHCEVVLVPARSLTYTSSGKLSRAAAKAQYLSKTVPTIHVAGESGRSFFQDDRPLAVSAGA